MTRRNLREHLFKELYFCGFFDIDDFDKQCDTYLEEEKISEENSRILKQRANDAISHLDEIDEKINAYAHGWKTSRMSRVDLSILRVAVYEILFDKEVPTGVAINEAVELAKIYGGEESYSFINGILGKLSKEIGEV